MQTDKIKVLSDGSGRLAALDETEKFAGYVGLSSENAMRVRLLAEETLGMVQAIVGEFEAEFWMESHDGGICQLHLAATANIDYDTKQALIDTSTRKQNEASKGFMGMIRELLEYGLYSTVDQGLQTSLMFGAAGLHGDAAVAQHAYLWSLEQFRSDMDEQQKIDPEAHKLMEDLEKSIVGKIADDVRVSVDGDEVEMVIEKKFAEIAG